MGGDRKQFSLPLKLWDGQAFSHRTSSVPIHLTWVLEEWSNPEKGVQEKSIKVWRLKGSLAAHTEDQMNKGSPFTGLRVAQRDVYSRKGGFCTFSSHLPSDWGSSGLVRWFSFCCKPATLSCS